MTIILFLVDTSASMNQRCFYGGRPTLLDVAKSAVELFVKSRQRSQESRGDRYMLLTFEEPPFNIKAGWKENLATFMTELKNLQATGLTSLGSALKSAFDLLNINRMQTGIDMYGQGRYPYYLEPAVIVCITDGGKMSSNAGVHDDLNVPMTATVPGSELTREPFRWDQRLFSLVLRLAGTPPPRDDGNGLVPSDHSPIDSMCEVTGGRSYAVTSQKVLSQCIDSLVGKVQSGVVIHFEKMGPDPLLSDPKSIENGDAPYDIEKDPAMIPLPPGPGPNGSRPQSPNSLWPAGSGQIPSWHSSRKLIYVPRSAQKGFAIGFWPIPETFWPDANAPNLPPRAAHPLVKFSCANAEPLVIENLPFDKYEVEPSPLTQFILARRQPTTCWQVFVPLSSKGPELGHPFGYLKASTNLQSVNMFVMPYNYPVLLPLLDDLFKVHRGKPPTEWRQAFAAYLRSMPPYYAAPLRKALQRMGAPPNLTQNLVPESLDNNLSYSVLNYLKRLKNVAKTEFEKLCSEVSTKKVLPPDSVRITQKSALKKNLLAKRSWNEKFSQLHDQITDFANFAVSMRTDREVRPPQVYRNPYDIPRESLLDSLTRLRANFLQPVLSRTKLIDDDLAHSMPVSQMGNYQEYLKRAPQPLREIDVTPMRQHMFGNPFKIDKRMMIDEADIDNLGGTANSQGRGVKRPLHTDPTSPKPGRPLRKPGPLPKEFVYKRRALAPTMERPVHILIPQISIPQFLDRGLPSPAPFTPPASPVPSLLLDDEERELSIFEDDRSSPETDDAEEEDMLPNGPLPQLVNGSREPPEPEIKEETMLSDVVSNGLHRIRIRPPTVKPDPLAPLTNGLNGEVKLEKLDSQTALHNRDVRASIFREIRRPGKNFRPILSQLKNVKGPGMVREAVVQQVIEEAIRFKRHDLVLLVRQTSLS